jgi:hypothetical protein
MSKDIGVKLKQPMFSNTFNAGYLKDISKGNIIPDENRLITLSKYAQIPIDFFYQKNNSIEDVAIAKEKCRILELEEKIKVLYVRKLVVKIFRNCSENIPKIFRKYSEIVPTTAVKNLL